MKKFLLFLIISLAHISLFAQSLQLMKKDGSAIVNDTILISTVDDASDIEVPVYVKNISSNTLEVVVKIYVHEFVSGSSATYCWDQCYDIEYTQSKSVTINAGDTAKVFHSDFNPNGNTGISKIMYTFFVNTDINDSVSVTINYEIVATGIDNLTKIKASIKSYPNPANDLIYFDYTIGNNSESYIRIYDLVGKKVKQLKLDNLTNSTQIDISDLNTGIYIWTIEIDGVPIKSNKLIKK